MFCRKTDRKLQIRGDTNLNLVVVRKQRLSLKLNKFFLNLNWKSADSLWLQRITQIVHLRKCVILFHGSAETSNW